MTDVFVPLEQEGTEAVVSRWLIAVGDHIEADAPLVELETDKVSVEIPAPVSGVLAEILILEREAARPGTVLARITEDGVAPGRSQDGAPEAAQVSATKPAGVPAAAGAQGNPDAAGGRDMSHWHSPAVRKALTETGLDPMGLQGSGRGGRLTRDDVYHAARAQDGRAAVGAGEASRTAAAMALTAGSAPQQASDPRPANARHLAPAAGGSASAGRLIPHDPMRLAIARNMVRSMADAPQVTAVFEADFGAIMAHRARHKAAFESGGIALSYTAYIVLAAARAMQTVPEVNSRWQDDALEVFADVNIGIGTALGDKGLVVPVIRRVQDLSLRGVAAQLQDLTARARGSSLTPQDMRGGTFTISNHGVSGSLLAAPIIINPGQSAILGIGKLEKRVVVREVGGADTIQIRPMAYVTLTIDHRVLDGHQTNVWLSAFVAALEGWDGA